MRTSGLIALTIFFVILMAGHAFALGEVFQGVITDVEYCGDYYYHHVKQNLWAYIADPTEIVVSFTPDFEAGTVFSMYGLTYLTGKGRAVFVGGAFFVDGSYATIQGTASLDKFGNMKNMKGTFIQEGVLDAGCFSSGNFRTTVRVR